MKKTNPSRGAPGYRIRRHYRPEVEVLQHYLQAGMVPMGDPFGWRQPAPGELAYLGDIETHLEFTGTIKDLTDDLELQQRLLAKALELELIPKGSPDPRHEELEISCGSVYVDVEFPLDDLTAVEQALHRLRVLLVNTQGVLGGDGHSWSLQVGERMAIEAYWQSKTKLTEWKCESAEAEADLVDLLCQAGVNLRDWCSPDEWYADEDLPNTRPLNWVRQRKVVETLFGIAPSEDTEEVERAIAYALHALREEQPGTWKDSLFLADALVMDQPTLEACNTRLADRLSTLPALVPYADRIRRASTPGEVDSILKELYDAAPAFEIWLIT